MDEASIARSEQHISTSSKEVGFANWDQHILQNTLHEEEENLFNGLGIDDCKISKFKTKKC